MLWKMVTLIAAGGALAAGVVRLADGVPRPSRHDSAAATRQGTPVPEHLRTGRWLRIIATNDFHGALEPRRDGNGNERGGAAALAAEIERARAECVAPACVSLLLDGGDEFQGTPASNLAFGRPVVALFNRLGYVASALGNHEFDWGQDTLRARMRDAHYAILAANVTYADGRDVPWIRNDTIVQVGDRRVGILGLATVATPSTTRTANVDDLRFLPPAPVVDAEARALRERGADLVVVVDHAGAFCNRDPHPACNGEVIDMARGVTARVDAVVSGHTHSPIATVIRGVPVVQAWSSGSALGLIDLPLDPGGTPVVALRDVRPDAIAPDTAVARLVSDAEAGIRDRVQRPVARIATRMGKDIDGPLGNLIADAQRAAAGGDVAVMNAGGVRAALDSGTATWGDLYEVQPFGNLLVRLTVTGSDLRGYLERLVARRERNAFISGVTITYDTARASGSRIVSATMSDGAPLDDARRYRLVLSDFLATGGDGLGLSGRALTEDNLGIVDLDALVSWLESRPSPVRAPAGPRFMIARP